MTGRRPTWMTATTCSVLAEPELRVMANASRFRSLVASCGAVGMGKTAEGHGAVGTRSSSSAASYLSTSGRNARGAGSETNGDILSRSRRPSRWKLLSRSTESSA